MLKQMLLSNPELINLFLLEDHLDSQNFPEAHLTKSLWKRLTAKRDYACSSSVDGLGPIGHDSTD